MQQETFDKFCEEKRASVNFKETFYHYLMAKFNGNILENTDLELEWNNFLTFMAASF